GNKDSFGLTPDYLLLSCPQVEIVEIQVEISLPEPQFKIIVEIMIQVWVDLEGNLLIFLLEDQIECVLKDRKIVIPVCKYPGVVPHVSGDADVFLRHGRKGQCAENQYEQQPCVFHLHDFLLVNSQGSCCAP